MGRRCVCGPYCRLYVAYGECLLARAQIYELKGVNAAELHVPSPKLPRGLIFCCVSDERCSLEAFSQLTRTCHSLSGKFQQDLWLKQRYVEKTKVSTTPAVVFAFERTMAALVADLPAASMFPLFDFWRLAILEPTTAQFTRTPLVKVLNANHESVS